MVDVGQKPDTQREAVATGRVIMKPATLKQVKAASLKKGDALAVARVAGILAAKKTADLIPMCHPLSLTGVEMGFTLHEEGCRIEIEARVKTVGPTGVEMEALCAVMGAGLTIYDMCKAIDRGITLSEVRLVYKHGGKSGEFRAPEFRDSVDF